jgi:pilus assembly protein CpaE
MIVAFFGTKGGTGTTTLAVNTAAEVFRLSRRPTVVVDAKPAPGDVAVFLGLRPRYTLIELIDQVGWTDAALAARFVAAHDCGIHVVAASQDFGRPSSRDAEGVEQTLQQLQTVYDTVVVDAGSSLTTSAKAVLTLADVVILVGNPDVPCLRNLQRLTDALRLAGVGGERIRIALNRLSDLGALPAAHIEKALSRPIDFQIGSDYRTAAAAVNAGVPVGALRPTDLHAQINAMARALLEPTPRPTAA